MKRSEEAKPVLRFSASPREGFCLGCGGTIHPGERKKSLDWHAKCYLRVSRLWTKGLKYRRRRCPGCGKTFEAIGQRYNAKTCSRECHRLRRLKERWKQRRKKGKPIVFSDHRREGFCLLCGGKTRWVKDQLKLTGKIRDSVNWHRPCYERFYRWWMIELYQSREHRHICVVCKKPFTAVGYGAWKRKTCSEGCRREHAIEIAKAWRERFRAKHMDREERACIVCGKPFSVGGGLGGWNKKTCSRACRLVRKRQTTAAWRKAHPRIPMQEQERPCLVCGKAFIVGGGRGAWNKKTCSIPCRYEWKRRKLAAWEKAHPGRSSKEEGGKIEARKSSGSLQR